MYGSSIGTPVENCLCKILCIFHLALYLKVMVLHKSDSLLEFVLCYMYFLFCFVLFCFGQFYLAFLFNLLD